MLILEASQLSCVKQHRVLFQDIDLSVKSGELVLIKGENGAGKTSLLRILVGLSAPRSGTVLINSHNIQDDINSASKNMVYVGHKLGLSGLLTAVENLKFYAQMRTNNIPSDDEIEMVLSTLSLEGLDDLPVKHLSAGQQRRVALAKLWLHKNANVWILDEPFTALDAATVLLLEQHIESFLNDGGAVIMTSHQASSLSDRMRTFELEYAW